MSEQTFKSPGFFEREIDLSSTSASSVGTPAGVIGTAQKGPAFLPVTVSSFDEFISIFGEPDGKRFGPYAVKEFLKNRNALTYVRVLGAGGDPSSDTNYAGFKVAGANVALTGTSGDFTDTAIRPVGHTQFILSKQEASAYEVVGNPIFTDTSIDTSSPFELVRGMLLMPFGTRMMIHADTVLSGTTWDANGADYDDTAAPTAGVFKLILSGVAETTDTFVGIKVFSASLDPDSDLYINNVLNTDPTRFLEKGHVLYADFPVESDLVDTTTEVKLASDWDSLTSAGLKSFGDLTETFSNAKTTSYISQPFGDKEYNLFHFETLNQGAAMNEQFKVTISNLKFSVDPANKWGTFSVQIRNFFDTDKTKQVIEQFSNCNLNPASPRYIAKVIGDKNVYYNFQAASEAERRMVKTGMFKNKSSFVRIVMSNDVKSGNIPEETLPFGFKGLPMLDVSGNSLNTFTTGQSANADGNIALAHMPPIPYRFKVTKGSLASTGITYTGTPGTNESVDLPLTWGIKSTRLSKTLVDPLLKPNSGEFNPLLQSYVKLLGKSASLASSSDDDKFTLSRVAISKQLTTIDVDLGTAKEEALKATYIRNGVYMTPGNTISDTVPTDLSPATSITVIGTLAGGTGFATADGDIITITMDDGTIVTSTKTAGLWPNTVGSIYSITEVGTNITITTASDSADYNGTVTLSDASPVAEYNLTNLTGAPGIFVDASTTTRYSFASLANYKDKTLFNAYSKYMKFTNVFSGGFDGVNILDKDMAMMTDKSTSIDTDAGGLGGLTVDADVKSKLGLSVNPAGTGTTNNAVNSFRSAINILTDEMSSTINILAVPGMRDSFITDYAADKVRDYGMAIYLMDIPSYGYNSASAVVRVFDNDSIDPDTTETLAKFGGRSFDNNYVATYYPDVKIYDEYVDTVVEAPASIAAMAAISYTDKVAYPWFAPAGFNRASLDVVKGVTVRLNTADRDNLYEARINPIATFPNAGYVIFGQKTLQMTASSLDRVNVRRMLLEVKRQVVAVAKNMLFEQNNATTRAKFASQLKPKLSLIQTQQGVDMYSITVDDSNNTPSDIESNRMNGRVVLVPTRAIEYVAIDFIVTSSGVSFE